MPENGQRAPPMMGRTARLHHNGGCFLLLEKRDQVFPLDFAADHDVSSLINSVNLEHRFCGVEANHGNGHRGRSLSGCFATTGSWHIDAWGRPPHQPVARRSPLAIMGVRLRHVVAWTRCWLRTNGRGHTSGSPFTSREPSPCRSNTMLNTAIASPRPDIGSRTGRSMTRR